MTTEVNESIHQAAGEHDIDEGEDVRLDGAVTAVEGRGDGAGARSSTVGERASRRSRRNGSRTSHRGGALRRPVERTLAIARTDATTLGVLAAALDVELARGSDAFLAELAIASLEDAGMARSTLATLLDLLSVDDLEAGVLATGMVAERAAFKRLWAVLKTLDPSLASGAPTRAVQAGLAVARSARALPDAKRKALRAAAEVLA